MKFVKSSKPAAVVTAVIAAIAPKDLNINDPGKYSPKIIHSYLSNPK